VKKDRRLMSITNLLQRPCAFRAEYGQQGTVPATTTYPTCVYFMTELEDLTNTVTKDTVTTVPLFSARNVSQICDSLMYNTAAVAQGGVAFNDTTVSSSIAMKVVMAGSALYTVRNQSTDMMTVRAYYCRARQDTNTKNYNSGTTNPTNIFNVYHDLARGFAANGLDSTSFGPTTNQIMIHKSYTPFNSFNFTTKWKIFKVKKVIINPGRTASFSIKRKPFIFRPHKYFEINGAAGATNFRTSQLVYEHNKYETFCMFQIDSNIAGVGAAQAWYAKQISGNTPTAAITTLYKYKANLLPTKRTPSATLDSSGYLPQAASANTIVNPDESVLAEEKDAV